MPSPKTVKGSLQQNGGYWVVRGRVFDPVTHTYKQRSKSTGLKVKGNNKRKAEEEMRIILAVWENEANAVPHRQIPLFSEYVEKWLVDKRATTKGNTADSYRDYANNHILPVLGDLPVTEVTKDVLKKYRDDTLRKPLKNRRDKDKTLSVQSVKKQFIVIRGALEMAVEDGVIPVNYASAKDIKFQRPEKFFGECYTEEQASTLLKAAEGAGEPIRAAVTLVLNYGLRREEVCGLRWADIDFDAGVLHIRNTVVQVRGKPVEAQMTKTKRSCRTLPLISETVPYLKELKHKQEESGFTLGKVCRWPDGVELRPDYVTKGAQKLMKKCGLPVIRFHDLRATAATFAARRLQPKQVQYFLGHENISTTMQIYVHLLDEDKAAIADAMGSVYKNASFCSQSRSHAEMSGDHGAVKGKEK